MRKKNGFTLVELMAVIVLIALIMTIAIPNVLRLSKNTKIKAYDTKINLLESAAEAYGNDNLGAIKDSIARCSLTTNGTDVTDVRYFPTNENGLDDVYPCRRFTIDWLASNEIRRIEWDDEDVCNKRDVCTASQDKVVTNPVNNNVINKCFIYVYYRYNRIYAYFDKDLCDELMQCAEGVSNCNPDTVGTTSDDVLGRSYPPAFGNK